MCFDEAFVTSRAFGQVMEQRVEKRYVRTRGYGEVQVCAIRCRSLARVDDDQLCATLFTRRLNALIENRVTPGQIASDHHDEVSFFEVLVTPRNCISAEGALMTGH